MKSFSFYSDIVLIVVLAATLVFRVLNIVPLSPSVFIVLSILGLLPVIHSAVKSLMHKEVSIDLLASVALLFSFIAQEWYSAVFINLMLAFARVFDHWTEARTKHIIEHLLKYRPERVRIKQGKDIVEIPIEKVRVGDLVVIDMGDRVSVDGIVIDGQASVNESTLTGESMPVVKKIHDRVYASTLNESGSMIVRAEKVGSESRLAQIVTLVEEASRDKAPSEKAARTFTQWYIFVMLFGSAILYVFFHDAHLILAILLVVCADDIAVAVPLSLTTTIARGAQLGILIKGSSVIEKLPNIKHFMTDKTGTLTTSKPIVGQIYLGKNIQLHHFLPFLATASSRSQHPVNRSIMKYVEEKQIQFPAAQRITEHPGEGLVVYQGDNKLIVGKPEFLSNQHVNLPETLKLAMALQRKSGYSITALAHNGTCIGFLTIQDQVRPFAPLLVKKTKELGVKTWIMLTGDNAYAAKKVADEVGVDEYKSEMKPEEKLAFIRTYKHEHPGVLAMMGDGVNDAASLALADVSFAMGAIGSDAAIEAADIALMRDNLHDVYKAMALGKKTAQVIRAIFIIWGTTNLIGLGLVFAGILNPMLASAYNFVTDFFPILTAFTLMRYTPAVSPLIPMHSEAHKTALSAVPVHHKN